jgi:DNA-binding response OmpR family regulator
MNILVIEDDPIQAQFIKRFLSSKIEDCLLFDAKDGIEALDIVSSIKIDLMLLDISLPRMGGIDYIKSLKERKIVIPFIVISGGLSEKLLEELYHYGAIDCLNKPFFLEDLYNKVQRAI